MEGALAGAGSAAAESSSAGAESPTTESSGTGAGSGAGPASDALLSLSAEPTLDFKAALPPPAKASDIAVDVAAMTTDGGTTVLGQGDIDRLHERRRRWEQDRAQALDEAIGASPFIVQADLPRGLMHLVVRPIASDGGLRLRVWPSDRQEDLLGALVEAQQSLQFTEAWDPKLPDLALGGKFTRTFRGISLTVQSHPPAAYDQHVEVLDDGTVRYVYGGLMSRYQRGFLPYETRLRRSSLLVCWSSLASS